VRPLDVQVLLDAPIGIAGSVPLQLAVMRSGSEVGVGIDLVRWPQANQIGREGRQVVSGVGIVIGIYQGNCSPAAGRVIGAASCGIATCIVWTNFVDAARRPGLSKSVARHRRGQGWPAGTKMRWLVWARRPASRTQDAAGRSDHDARRVKIWVRRRLLV